MMILFVVVAAPVLGDVELGPHDDAALGVVLDVQVFPRRGRGGLDLLQLDLVHDALFALAKGHAAAERVGPVGALGSICSTTAAATAATNAAEAVWCLVSLVTGARRAAEPRLEPDPEEREHHGQIGGHDGYEGLSRAPRAGQLGAVGVVLQNQGLAIISLLASMFARRSADTETYGKDKDSLDGGADEDEDAGAEHEGGGDLLNEAQTRPPEQGQRDQDEIDVG